MCTNQSVNRDISQIEHSLSMEMKCSSCKLPFNNGVQCSYCKKQLDFECAQISELNWKNLDLKLRCTWKCPDCKPAFTPAPVDATESATLEIVLKEIQELKSQLSCLPSIMMDIKTIRDKFSSEFTKKMVVGLADKVADLKSVVSENAHKQLELKVNSLQEEIAVFKSRISGSAQRTRFTNAELKGVSTREFEYLFTNAESVTKKRRSRKPSRIFYGMAFNICKYAFLIFRTYLDLVIDFIFGLFWDGMKKELPPLEKRHSMLALSAVELAEKIRKGDLKSEKLVEACIERIKVVNPIINAMTDERFDAALEEAKQIDKKIAEGVPEDYFKNKPFLGVPFTAKESHAVSGMLHTLGVTSRRHVRASEDAECVRLLKEAGAIALAVTNVPEINKWQESRNLVFGQTNNPYHTGRVTGGSSGGEAALAASLASPISLCSDIGGSTRMPAFYCGLFGHNPTAGHTSLKGSALRSGEDDTMASIGFISKHSCDLAPLTKIVAGDLADKLELDRPVDLKKVKFYYVDTARDLRVSPICKDLRNAMSKVLTHLTTEAASTDLAPQRYYHRGFDYMYSLWRYCMSKETENFAALLTNNQGEANGVVELFRKVIGQSEYSGAAILKLLDDQVLPRVNAEWAEALIKELKDDILSTLGADSVLLFPSAPAPAPHHYSAFLRPFNFAYWTVFNVLRLPATQVPLGLNAAGLPLGIQVVSGPRQDALCLAVATHLEKTFGGFVPPCSTIV